MVFFFLWQVLMFIDEDEDGFLQQRLPALHSMTPQDGVATAYICQDFTCSLPVTDPQELRRLLLDESSKRQAEWHQEHFKTAYFCCWFAWIGIKSNTLLLIDRYRIQFYTFIFSQKIILHIHISQQRVFYSSMLSITSSIRGCVLETC